MKEEIEKILKEQITYVPQLEGFIIHGAIRELQKLFLSKQVESMSNILSSMKPFAVITQEEINRLQSELKQLE
jgi:hypothetical protein